MPRKPRKPSASKLKTFKNESATTSYTDETKEQAISQYGADISSVPSQHFAVARTQFQNYQPNTSLRESYTRSDYEYFRPEEATPQKYKEVMAAVENSYKKVAIVRNVVDLMADFITEGISVSHPVPKVERFYRAWFKKVKGTSLSNKFCIQLYSASNVLVHARHSTINKKTSDTILESYGAEVTRNQFPIAYSLINPMSVDILNEETATFTGKYDFGIRLPQSLVESLSGKGKNKSAINKVDLPDYIADAIKSKNSVLPADLSPYFYKKMDWELWAYPMLGPILSDLIYLEKMKLADISALDGAMTQIRLWKLGNLDKNILPKPAAINKLNEILLSNIGGGVMDLIWGPDIELVESKSSTELYKFLGSDKYQFVMSAVYEGLGLPYNKSVSNSVNSLKVFMSRLNEGRVQLADFWNAELKKVQKAMGFKESATISFRHPIVDDENAEKALWIQLADRDIVPIEMVQERFNLDARVTHAKLRKQKVRSKKMPRVSPFHDPAPDMSLKKIFAQNGEVSPSQVGLKLSEKDTNEKSRIETLQEYYIQKQKLSSKSKEGKAAPPQFDRKSPQVTQNGRPIGAKDSGARKTRSDKQSVAMYLWAKGAQNSISEAITPKYLQLKNKKNLRQLTVDEHKELEQIKFQTLSAMKPFADTTENSVYSAMKDPLNENLILYHTNIIEGLQLSVESERETQLQSYVRYYDTI